MRESLAPSFLGVIMSETKVKGADELMRFLAAFPQKLAKNAIKAGLTAAAKPIRDQARVNAAKASGKMAKSIKTGSPSSNKDGTFSVRIRAKGDHDYIARFIEYGVAPHFISAGDSGFSARMLTHKAEKIGIVTDADTGKLKIGNSFVSGAVHHPGFAARPFLRPAFDQKAEEAAEAFAERIRTYINSKTGAALPITDVD